MINNNVILTFLVLTIPFLIVSCDHSGRGSNNQFDNMRKRVEIGNWMYELRVQKQHKAVGSTIGDSQQYFLKATLAIGNIKTHKSLLYSASRDVKDYEAKYKYMAFQSGRNLYIKYVDKVILPIGYVFEPSNGLNPEERLVYKFALPKDQYKALKSSSMPIEFWYIDNIVGNGKICFSANY